MEYKDYYKILGVENTSTQDQIKIAYRKLARKYHPDLNKDEDAEDKFKEVGEAYEALKDIEKRAAYDQLGQSYKYGQDFQPPPNWDQGFEFSGQSGDFSGQNHQFSDFFEGLFGEAYKEQRSEQARARFDAKGQDHHAKVGIDIPDSFHGAKRTIGLKVPELSLDGHVLLKERKLDVTIPKGVREGQHIRLKGQGASGLGEGKSGDLYLEIIFNPHSDYYTEGADLFLKLPVTPWEAALGGKVKIPTPGGEVDLTIPANSGQGKKLRLKGRGLPAKKAGDLYVILQIALPPADTDKAKELYEKMASELDFDPRSNLMKTAV